MQEWLKEETVRLERSWMRHDRDKLRDYLVASVEDPRINLQSILARHFLLEQLAPGRFKDFMEEECRFAAAMNWLMKLCWDHRTGDDAKAILRALERNADNAEGTEIPRFILQTWRQLRAENSAPPNYITSFLNEASCSDGVPIPEKALGTFISCSKKLLVETFPAPAPVRASVLELACGSANDYRFLNSSGIARLIKYCGIDLCSKNIENARQLFPNVSFELGNIFEIPHADQSFDFCLVQDLFEHLSLEGLEVAVGELCRVTRRGICAGFFQMDEQPEHITRPLDEYHWNLLSMGRMKQAFAARGFSAQVFHIDTFLRQSFGMEATHNPNAYTFYLRRHPAPL